ncbi:hypothetical protein ID850_12810 [Xenorhabdus sp. Flor]|uniref:hypothetical protein n=1 Tax=Xenorhabdus cabanillasii TaxID=351673 RepID=UPI001995F78C|nr:hypothetical protein [Xenorhabdus sp. Flor]MBD2815629.1 hypothetical protein [Xenorhabdus sp. Flor]
MKLDSIITELKNRFPCFDRTYDGDDDIYLIYGAFGSYVLDVINLYSSNENVPRNYFYVDIKGFYKEKDCLDMEIKSFFNFIDELFSYKDELINDVLNTCIFGALIGNDYSYNLARKYLNKEVYNHYLEITKRVI